MPWSYVPRICISLKEDIQNIWIILNSLKLFMCITYTVTKEKRNTVSHEKNTCMPHEEWAYKKQQN